ncbi:uncharacterized protein LOC115033115 [Acyrthosiphon pisum]|uniref:DDE Tnp4 domain-containing protein n=1 Tax=Acyrthosiphon pisum TaxID=7029 RepID=A0A8R2NJ93_ACYPI|nr:uncharacterized protein LOC115033115 [Acyrthosiphon pisum]
MKIICRISKIPSNEEEWLEKAKEFEDKWSFPHAIAAMDGKHVIIQAPSFSGTEYYNYKQFFSIVLFALVDADYNFMYVDVGTQGRISDGGVFKNTNLYKKMERHDLNIPEPHALRIPYLLKVPYMILADKAFAMNEYTIKPFEGNPEVGSPQRVFNNRLSRGRRVVENAFGILSAVFRVLRKSMALQPEIASKIVLTTIYLHNFLRKRPSCLIYTPPGSLDTEKDGALTNGRWRQEQPTSSLLSMRNIPRRITDHAKTVRLHLADHFVLNDVLPWQNNY